MATRNSKRVKTFAMLVKNVDDNQRQQRTQARLDMLESDYYDSPNKLAEEELSDHSNKKKGKIIKQAKKKLNNNLRKNLNLKKILKSYTQSPFPDFISATTKGSNKSTQLCSICHNLAKYRCPRCQERYCSLDCSITHREIQCLRIDNY